MKKEMLTYMTSLVPFIEHDDATRVQMACNQMNQAIKTSTLEIPYVQTGYESMFADLYCIKSKYGATIEDQSLHNIIVKDGEEYKLHNIDWKYQLKNDDAYIPAGETIANDIYSEDGILKLGQNLKTAVMVYHGYNYEDAIILNERLASANNSNEMISFHCEKIQLNINQNEILLSIKDKTYQPIPFSYDTLKLNDPIAIKKLINQSDLKTFFEKPKEIKFENDNGILYDIKIFPNNWNTTIREYDMFIKNYLYNIRNKLNDFITKFKGKLSSNDLLRYIYRNKLDIPKQINKHGEGTFKIKKETFSGVIIELTILYAKSLNEGDKFANRHGNKGVVSLFQEDSKMPKLPDGSTPDIIINPLGIISRMNIGQNKEIQVGTIVEYIRKVGLEEFNKGNYENIYNMILETIYELDNTKTGWYYKSTKQQLDDVFQNKTWNKLESIIKYFYIIQPPFESSSNSSINKLLNKFNLTTTYKLFDPILNSYIINNIDVGPMYWMKLYHMSSEKYAARSVANYSAKTMQPLAGKKNKGGQKFGEMETWCLASYDAMYNLNETLTIKSDNINDKYKYISTILSDINIAAFKHEKQDNSETYNILESYFKILGLKI